MCSFPTLKWGNQEQRVRDPASRSSFRVHLPGAAFRRDHWKQETRTGRFLEFIIFKGRGLKPGFSRLLSHSKKE
jgi:hypothetical protein